MTARAKSRAELERRIAAAQGRVVALDERIGELMAQRVATEEVLADLYRQRGPDCAACGRKTTMDTVVLVNSEEAGKLLPLCDPCGLQLKRTFLGGRDPERPFAAEIPKAPTELLAEFYLANCRFDRVLRYGSAELGTAHYQAAADLWNAYSATGYNMTPADVKRASDHAAAEIAKDRAAGGCRCPLCNPF